MSALCGNCGHPEHAYGECTGRVSSFSGGDMACQCNYQPVVAPAADGLVPVEDALRDAIAEAKRLAVETNETYAVMPWHDGFITIKYDIDATDGTYICSVKAKGSLEFYDWLWLPARVRPTGTGR